MMNKSLIYLAPEAEVLEVAVERGFANSIEDPVENEEQDW
jgi:hypothetical protein